MQEQHTCEAVVLHCIDFRFRKALSPYLMSRFPEGYDVISVAGAAKQLVADDLAHNFVLEQLRVSDRLHSPKTMVLIQHEDCGAYGGSKALGDIGVEQNFQKAQLESAEQLLKQYFPQHIEKHFVRLSGEIISL